MMGITLILLVVSLILALLAAFGVSLGRVNAGWLAFAFFVLAQLV